MRPLKALFVSLIASGLCFAYAQTPDPGMAHLRKTALTRTAADWKFKPDQAFPSVYGVVVDFPIEGGTITILSLRDGHTSLYSTGTFGVIGGGSHRSVRVASLNLIKFAASYWPKGKPTRDVSYPRGQQVRFYLLGYRGLRVLETTMPSLEREGNPYEPLWHLTNDVMTQLRTISQSRER